jgi:hypothetical protein
MAREDEQHPRSRASGKGKGRGKGNVRSDFGGRAGVHGMAHAAPSPVHDAFPSSSATGYHAHHAARGDGQGHQGGRGGAPPHSYDDRPRDADRGHFRAGGKGAWEGAPHGGRKGGFQVPSREACSRVAM